MKVNYRKFAAKCTAVGFAFLMAAFTSCEKDEGVPSLDKSDSFDISYGNFEDELNLFTMAQIGTVNTNIAMRDGFFYIANGESRKIMEMNSYGDMLALYFNQETNPEPSFYDEENMAITTRKAVAYPFNEISSIAVDNRKYLYVVDKMPQERRELDEDLNSVLSQIVLRFDSNGNSLGYIGQQGPGGTPFPYVSNIYTTDSNELVVVCITRDQTLVYWFSSDGYLLYTIPIDSNFTENKKQDPNEWKTISNVIPDTHNRILYLMVDVYSNYIDEGSRMQSGITYQHSLIVPFNVADMTFGEQLIIPSYNEQITEGFSNESYNIPYDFIGMTEGGWMFFAVSTESGFSIQMMQSDGSKILKRNMPLNHLETRYYTFCLSNTGILVLLNVKKDNATVQWWRTDNLIQSIIKN